LYHTNTHVWQDSDPHPHFTSSTELVGKTQHHSILGSRLFPATNRHFSWHIPRKMKIFPRKTLGSGRAKLSGVGFCSVWLGYF